MNQHRLAGCAAGTALALAAVVSPAWAQVGAPPDPRAAQPERPTVATHAYAVAPGYVELETGFQRQGTGAQSNRLDVPVLFKIGLTPRLQLDLAPGWRRVAGDGTTMSGITDLVAGLKWRLTDQAPVLHAFAVQATVSLPTGSVDSGTGTGSAALNLLAISSRSIGPVALDINAGYTRSGGDGSVAPRDSSMWTVSSGFPIAGPVSWAAEIFGYPGTGGPSGARPVVGLLTGPTWTLRPSIVLDAGAVLNVSGFGNAAVYAGLTWNIGRAWTMATRPGHTARGPESSRGAWRQEISGGRGDPAVQR